MNDTPLFLACQAITRGASCLSNMIGPRYAEARRAALSALTGKRQPIAKCGINALESAIRLAAGISSDMACAAVVEDLTDIFVRHYATTGVEPVAVRGKYGDCYEKRPGGWVKLKNV